MQTYTILTVIAISYLSMGYFEVRNISNKKKMRKIKIILGIAALTAILFACHKDELVEKIPNSEFPDMLFRDYLLLHFDTDMDGFISKNEAKAVKEMDLSNMGIKSLAGLDYFTALEKLIVMNNSLESLNLSAFSMLEVLDCSNNHYLKTLVLPESKRLKSLNCSDTRLMSISLNEFKFLEDFTFINNVLGAHSIEVLDIVNSSVRTILCNNTIKFLTIRDLPDLEHISIKSSQYSGGTPIVDLTKSTKLKILTLSNFPCNINISTCTAIEELFVEYISNTTVDVSKNTALKHLSITLNESFDLDISNNKALETLTLRPNASITSFKNNTALKSVWLHAKAGLTLDFCSNSNLEKLYVDGNVDVKINDGIKFVDLTLLHSSSKTINMQQFTALKNVTLLSCNNLESLNLSGCMSLDSLRVECLTKGLDIDISNCINLRSLTLDVVNLNKLDASNCHRLSSFTHQPISDSSPDLNLTRLNLSNCSSLTSVSCYRNKLTDLDLSGCTKLTSLSCQNNKITNLNISGCTALATLLCQYNNLESLNLSSNKSLRVIYCFNNKLKTMNVSGILLLNELRCMDNNLDYLNVSGCVNLKLLQCTFNNLETINLSNCYSLLNLWCSSNKINDLKLSDCTALKEIGCESNQLKELDLYACLELQTLRCFENADLKKLILNKNHQISYLHKDDHTEIVLKE